jgi:hypothetical protein
MGGLKFGASLGCGPDPGGVIPDGVTTKSSTRSPGSYDNKELVDLFLETQVASAFLPSLSYHSLFTHTLTLSIVPYSDFFVCLRIFN